MLRFYTLVDLQTVVRLLNRYIRASSKTQGQIVRTGGRFMGEIGARAKVYKTHVKRQGSLKSLLPIVIGQENVLLANQRRASLPGTL